MTSCFDWEKVKHECIGIENTATFGGPHHAGLGVGGIVTRCLPLMLACGWMWWRDWCCCREWWWRWRVCMNLCVWTPPCIRFTLSIPSTWSHVACTPSAAIHVFGHVAVFVVAVAVLHWRQPLNVVWCIGFYAYINRFQIQPEERILTQKFGEPFKQYCLQVHRWLGHRAAR